MPKIYTDEFLISELLRFHRENGRVPTSTDMTPKNGYPAAGAYQNHFGSYSNVLEITNLSLHKTNKRTGLETCCKCGRNEKHGWITKGLAKGEVMCHSCYRSIHTDYMTNNLDKESNTAKATISQRVAANVLNLEMKHDCNCTYGFKHPVDLYHKEKYKYINVKDSKLHDNNSWSFCLKQKVTPDTYIMLGYDENRKNILKVWITDAIDDFVFNEKTEMLMKTKKITNTYKSLKKAEPWEVDAKPYNDMLHKMSQKRKNNNGKGCFLRDDDLI